MVPEAECAEVKSGVSRTAALMLSHPAACALIREKARRAMERLPQIKPYKLAGPVELKIEFTPPGTKLHQPREGVERLNERTWVFRGKRHRGCLGEVLILLTRTALPVGTKRWCTCLFHMWPACTIDAGPIASLYQSYNDQKCVQTTKLMSPRQAPASRPLQSHMRSRTVGQSDEERSVRVKLRPPIPERWGSWDRCGTWG